jgi:enoyl-CoA hydratase/carnithine racemase
MLQRAFSLDSAGKAELTEVISDLNTTQPPRVLILTDTHSQAFLVDVAELADMSATEARAFSSAGHRLAQALEDVPCPTIAAVEGLALGGGCELALACDLTIAGEGARFGQIEALGGVMPGFGGTWRLARRVGYQQALEMMFTAAVVDASTALGYGLVVAVTQKGRGAQSSQGARWPHHENEFRFRERDQANREARLESAARRGRRAGGGKFSCPVRSRTISPYARLSGTASSAIGG